jgi:CRP-like cAMP-binding protein
MLQPYSQIQRTVPAALVASHPTLKLYPKQALYYHGDRSESLYRLKEGLIRLTRMTSEGRVMTLRHVLAGDYFGEEVLLQLRRSDSAEALTEAVVEVIDVSRIPADDLLAITQSLTLQLRRQLDYEYHLHAGNLKQRVARYLYRLAQTPLASVAPSGHTVVHAKHELIAEGTASTRESVSKLMSELRSEKIVQTKYCSVVILDMDALQLLAEEGGY